MLRQLPHLRLGHPCLREYGYNPELSSGLPARTVVALVIFVRPVNDAGVTFLLSEFRQVRVERALAEVAAVRWVAGVVRVVELAGVYDEVLHPEGFGELPRQIQLRWKISLVVRRDGEYPVFRWRPRCDGEGERGIDPAGEGD